MHKIKYKIPKRSGSTGLNKCTDIIDVSLDMLYTECNVYLDFAQWPTGFH